MDGPQRTASFAKVASLGATSQNIRKTLKTKAFEMRCQTRHGRTEN